MSNLNWHRAGIEEIGLLQKVAVNNGVFANNYSAVNSFLYAKKYDSQIALWNDWIFEKYYVTGETSIAFPHRIDGKNSGAGEALSLLVEDAKLNKKPCIFRNITAEEKELLLENFTATKIEEAPDLSDYIYNQNDLAELPGSKYSKKRNHVNQFRKKYPDFHLELITPENFKTVCELEKKWFSESSESLDLRQEAEIICCALQNFEELELKAGMKGGILFAGDQPAAFCLSSTLSPEVTDIHFEKCLSSFARDGGYAVINNEYAKTITTKYINREEDLGIEGLRKAKRSYYPEILLPKFNVEVKSDLKESFSAASTVEKL